MADILLVVPSNRVNKSPRVSEISEPEDLIVELGFNASAGFSRS